MLGAGTYEDLPVALIVNLVGQSGTVLWSTITNLIGCRKNLWVLMVKFRYFSE